MEKINTQETDVSLRKMPLNSEFVELVKTGYKESTVRKGRRSVQAGSNLVLTDGSENQVAVHVTNVKMKRFDELTEPDARRDGFDSLEHLLEALKSIYPQINSRDLVTVISFVLQGNRAYGDK